MNTSLFKAGLISLGLSIGGTSVGAEIKDPVRKFCIDVVKRSDVVRSKNQDDTKEIKVTQEQLKEVLDRLSKAALYINYSNNNCTIESSYLTITFENGLVYQTLIDLKLSQKELEKQLSEYDSLFWATLLKYYLDFHNQANGLRYVGPGKLNQMNVYLKIIKNKVINQRITPAEGIKEIYALFS